ncbi:DUF2267 domain-containing protein [Lipingzhangella sp. LS1_29]|uniref:DUF2267 domain-containing protein n=1 Tax=Lipingzhangella rawalii TaxID=2055835 RepID=A0ABU2HC59_9ACTN|nr:DUF2267 domain-containing protein [Lipingzhangella rawalii]MDS1272415.1 DUF2267 domain-containing protein [Lipingzhangella rawalii]
MYDESTDGAEERFLARVQQHAGLTNRAEARRLTEATLNELAVAVSGGQVEQLVRNLPEPLQPGTPKAGQATAFDKQAFLDAVSGSVPSTDLEEMEVLASAVLNAVREEAPDRQVDDTLAQLPPDLAALFHGSPRDREA